MLPERGVDPLAWLVLLAVFDLQFRSSAQPREATESSHARPQELPAVWVTGCPGDRPPQPEQEHRCLRMPPGVAIRAFRDAGRVSEIYSPEDGMRMAIATRQAYAAGRDLW